MPGIQAEPSLMPEVQPTTVRTAEAMRDGCPFLRRAVADWLWPVEGICRARMDGRLMVPPIPHYLQLCNTGDHRLCEVLRARLRLPNQAAA